MSGTQKIEFSEKALAKRQRGARLYALNSVRASWTWILFGVIGVFLTALVLWGFFGSVVETVGGRGLLVSDSGMNVLSARGSGTLIQLNVRPGMHVDRGQVIGEIYNPEVIFSVRRQEREYAQLVAECDALTAGSEELAKVRIAIEKEREKALASLTEKYDESVSRSRRRAGNFRTLQRERAISVGEYYSSLDALLNTEAELLGNRLQVLLSSAQLRELDWDRKKNIITLENERLIKSFEVELSHKLFREAFWIVAEREGTVLELRRDEGDAVAQGDTIAVVSSDGSEGLHLVGYLSPEDGKKVRTGMSAYFAPSHVKSGEFGYMVGVVRDVSATPISSEAVFAELDNPGLTQAMTGGGAVIRVTVELVPDPNTESGCRWTSRRGAPVTLTNGTQGTLIVNTRYRRPASFIVPSLRGFVLGS